MATRRFRKSRRQRKTNRRNRRYRGGAHFSMEDQTRKQSGVAGWIIMGSNSEFNAFVGQNSDATFKNAGFVENRRIRNTAEPAIQARVYKNPSTFGAYYIEGPPAILQRMSNDAVSGRMTATNYETI